ncbi:cyclophilin-like family protein [Natronorarus salvus]|uniref:cyclophilin-like family protein n=1 Tax=Natronorarus salvus TaxID=3117733 RepID=UPI002F269636
MSGLECRVDDRTLAAEWTDDSPETRAAVEAALPLSGEASRWGEELYFRTDVDVGPENPRELVDPGTIAYWPAGNALCLFWGPTPASEGEEPRAASPVNVVARVEDVSALADLEGSASVELREG